MRTAHAYQSRCSYIERKAGCAAFQQSHQPVLKAAFLARFASSSCQ